MGTVEVVAVETGALTEGTERARVPTMEVLALGKMSPPSPSERGLKHQALFCLLFLLDRFCNLRH